jgi:general stress protein 26
MSEITMEELQKRLKGDRTAMLTTIDERGTLSSRPLTVQQYNEFGDVFFLVGRDADWVTSGTEAANVSIVDDNTWVSIAGRLLISDDEALLDELWDDVSATFFENGKADAVVAHVQSDRWEYWTAPTAAVQVFEFIKAKVTSTTPHVGDSGTIET